MVKSAPIPLALRGWGATTDNVGDTTDDVDRVGFLQHDFEGSAYVDLDGSLSPYSLFRVVLGNVVTSLKTSGDCVLRRGNLISYHRVRYNIVGPRIIFILRHVVNRVRLPFRGWENF